METHFTDKDTMMIKQKITRKCMLNATIPLLNLIILRPGGHLTDVLQYLFRENLTL